MIAFFDPNFGEFYFPKKSDSVDWFHRFWHYSGYVKQFSGFYLLCYAKAI